MEQSVTAEARATATYQACFDELRRYLRRLVRDESLADELAQEAGLRLIRTARTQDLHEPRAWLFHAAANLARDALRRRMTAQSGQEHLAAQVHEGPAAPDAHAHAEQQFGRVAQAIEGLPGQARRILLMARVEGMSHKEIARRMNLSPKTVENHLARALAKLSQVVGKHDGWH